MDRKHSLLQDDPEDYLKTPEQREADIQEMHREILLERQEEQELILAYQRLFNSEDGKKVLNHLSQEFSEFQPCFISGQSDLTAYALGQRNVLLHIREKLRKQII